MKDKLITQIQTGMAALLNSSQLSELGRVLSNALHYVEISEKKRT